MVKYQFDSVTEYHTRHYVGTEAEFDYEVGRVTEFNKLKLKFDGWPICAISKDGGCETWLFATRYGSTDWKMPKEGDTCKIRLERPWPSIFWHAKRIENPCASLGLSTKGTDKFAFFRVFVKEPKSEADEKQFPHKGLKPLINKDTVCPGMELPLYPHLQAQINFRLDVNDATKKAEINALETLVGECKAMHPNRVGLATQYLLDFKDPAFFVDLRENFPHLKDLDNLPKLLQDRVGGFNNDQKKAFHELLSKLPCGICILPGGPGAGKTFFNLTLAAALQSKDSVTQCGHASDRPVKILYMIDINRPLDDVVNKMSEVYRELSMSKKSIRMYGWSYEMKTSTRLNMTEEADDYEGEKTPCRIPEAMKDEEVQFLDFTKPFMDIARQSDFTKPGGKYACAAPSLDEAAWAHFDENKDKYPKLAELLPRVMKKELSSISNFFRNEVNKLYNDVLEAADFVATTPCAASQHFQRMFSPDLVIFDEASHARECSNLIALSCFKPIAWVFSGDHRQTKPFLASQGDEGFSNPHGPQLQTSMMKRADQSGAISHQLLINHRAYGNLQELASRLFYHNKMVSGISEDQRFPDSVQHLQGWLEKLFKDKKCETPRAVVQLEEMKGRSPDFANSSFFCQKHVDWVMEKAKELLTDSKFMNVKNSEKKGTIMVITPYKEAFFRYKDAIRRLVRNLGQPEAEARIEVRTIDTVQGHEADVIILDFVRDRVTGFMDDPNRLCVALTRARQAEIVLMHPDLTKSRSFWKSKYVKFIWHDCHRQGQDCAV